MSPILGDAISEPILTKLGTSDGLADRINCVNFGDDRFVWWDQNGRFIYLTGTAHSTAHGATALTRDWEDFHCETMFSTQVVRHVEL
jgi:hypothetical protein